MFQIKFGFTFQAIPEAWFDPLVCTRFFIQANFRHCHDLLKAFPARRNGRLLFKELDQLETVDCLCLGVVNANIWLTCTTAHLQKMNLTYLTSDFYSVTVYIHVSHPHFFLMWRKSHFLSMIHLAYFRNHLSMR